MSSIVKNLQFYKFSLYGFFKNLKFFEPFLILFFLDKGLSYTQIGVLYAIREISINLLEIPTGVMADLLGRKRTMIASFVSYIASFLIFYLFSEFWVFILAMLAFSFGDAFRTGTHKAMIFEYLKLNNWQNQKVAYYGHTRSWSQIGSAVSSLIAAGIVIYTGNYSAVFLWAMLPYLADLLLIASYPQELDGKIRNNTTTLREKFVEIKTGIRISFKNRLFFKLIGNLAIFEGLFKASKDYLQPMVVLTFMAIPFLDDVSTETKSAVTLGLIYFLVYLITSYASRNSGWVVDKLGSTHRAINLTLWLGALVGIGSGFLIGFRMPVLALVVFVFLFFIQNIRKPVGVAAVADTFDEKVLATGLSVQSQFDSLFASLFALVLGVLADYTSVGNALIVASSVLLLLSIFVRLPHAEVLNEPTSH
ncbi:MAG: MFS transporter [Bacteroidetes bacterium HGW-Bacteroidetes-4]|jgi:MFS family permease|nr:MAG: MFS transporter [Bacteroidetes bacterium HGW-Bacteroidetes-4]